MSIEAIGTREIANLPLPKRDGLLQEPIKIADTNIEIIRPFDGTKVTTVLFDFDGTISLERNGWIDLMVKSNTQALIEALPHTSPNEARDWVIGDIEETIGIPTYMQMKRLSMEIEKSGGRASPPQVYKDTYNQRLNQLVAQVHQDIRNGSTKEYTVAGIKSLLFALQSLLGKDAIYVASGTDIKPVRDSIKFLSLDTYFEEDDIVAAGTSCNPEDDAKLLIIQELQRFKNLQTGNLLTFGDGFPELLYTYQVGGVAVALLTPDDTGFQKFDRFTYEDKRNRLIQAGAHILIPDFQNTEILIKTLTSKYP